MPNLPYTFYQLKDKARGVLSGAISDVATSFTTASGDGVKFPTADFCVRLEDEVIYIGSRSGETFSSLTRGYNGTTATSHGDKTALFQSADAALFKRIQDQISGHTHNKADIPDFAHTHPQGDITNLTTDLAAKEVTANKNAANGYAGLNGSSKLTGSQQVYGTGANTACEGNDSRLSDARTPTTHDILTTHSGFPGGTSTFLRADGAFAAPTATAGDLDIPGTGSITVATGKYHVSAKRHQLTTTQRITVAGTGRLRMVN